MRILFLMRDDGDMTEPMNLMLLSALAKHQRPHRETWLAVIERDDIVAVAQDYRPDVIAASAITGSHRAYLDAMQAMAQGLKGEVVSILGGPYCSTFPEVIEKHPWLDAIGVMECDEAWPEWLDALDGQDWDRFHTIPNIITQENKHQRLLSDGNATWIDPQYYRDRFSSLDTLPFMDRALVYNSTAFYHRVKRTHMAGRGCPYTCTYCFERDWNQMYYGKGKILQRYSVDRFLDELEWVGEQWDTRFWKFYDDVFPTFPSDIEWLEEFAEKYPARIGLPFHCLTRCDLVCRRPQVLELLKQAGVASITMSIESGNAYIRNEVLDRKMKESEIKEAFALCRSKGIATFANTILGVPGPGKNKRVQVRQYANMPRIDMRPKPQNAYDRESAWYNVKRGVSFGEFPILYPYPRTALGLHAVQEGWFDGDFDKLHHSYQNRSPLSCFTEHEKSVQQNLALLTPVAMLFSGSRHWWARWLGIPIGWVLIYMLSHIPRMTWLYEELYSLAKSYMHQERIYPMKRSWKERLALYRDVAKLDNFKQFMRKHIKRHRKNHIPRSERPGQTLGGPFSV